MRYLLVSLLLFISALLPSQTVHVTNHSAVPFNGWKRVTVDSVPTHATGTIDGCTYVLGRSCGLDVRVLDVRIQLAPGETKTLDLTKATRIDWYPAPIPSDLNAHFGGAPTLRGTQMIQVSVKQDGAAYSARYLGREGRDRKSVV